ncbi:MAG TPA: hypothetical protein VMJ10_22400 [Kofleriaceae bacterium]|nr:hypothetical protein [Kofleriaceae bacterium]
MRNWIALAGITFFAACGSSGSSIMCGEGTVEEDGQCVPTSGSGTVTCGAGTQLDPTGTMCVPTSGSGTTPGSPTISMMTPGEAGATGNVLFEIDGTSLAGSDPTMVHVYFGDTTPGMNGALGPCEAEIGMPSDTAIIGTVPPMCDLNVTVTVQTNLGMATTPFKYDALFAVDGDDYDSTSGSFGGNLWVIDPFAGMVWAAGMPIDAAGKPYNYSGFAFGSDGTMYAVTTGDSPGDVAIDSKPRLMTIAFDPTNTTTGITATSVGDLTDGTASHLYTLTDIKMSGTTLYGWAYESTNNRTSWTQGLVKINTANGKLTKVGTFVADSYGVGALGIDSTGTVYVAANSASSTDATGMITATGVLDSANMTSGMLTSAATLDYGLSAPVNSMTTVSTFLVAAIDDGYYGYLTGEPTHGVTLAIFDTAGTLGSGQVVNPLYEMPAGEGLQSYVHGMDVPPTTLSIADRVRTAHWTALAPATRPTLR